MLAALLLLSLRSAGALTALTGELCTGASYASELARAGDTEAAELQLRAALRRWEEAERHTRVFLPQEALERTEAAFYAALADLRAGEAQRAEISLAQLVGQLRRLALSEQPHFGSIF